MELFPSFCSCSCCNFRFATISCRVILKWTFLSDWQKSRRTEASGLFFVIGCFWLICRLLSNNWKIACRKEAFFCVWQIFRTCVRACVCAWLGVCVCVCLCLRERETESVAWSWFKVTAAGRPVFLWHHDEAIITILQDHRGEKNPEYCRYSMAEPLIIHLLLSVGWYD